MLNAVESQLGVSLPLEYADFLKYSNGAEGTIGENSYLVLWRIEELVPLNKAYAVSEFAPGLLLFGSDGGGAGYAFDTRSGTPPILEISFIGMDLNDTKLRGRTFIEFLEYLHKK